MAQADGRANAERIARFEDAHTRYERVRDGVTALRHDLADLEITGSSPDGAIGVVVDARGTLRQLTIAGDPELAAAVTAAVTQAQTLAAQAIQDRLKQTLPSTDLDQLLRRHDERMGMTNAA